MIIFGGLVMTISGEIMVILPLLGYFNIWTVILPFAGFAFGTGFVFPNGQAGSITPYPKMAGAAASLLSCLQISFAATLGARRRGFLEWDGHAAGLDSVLDRAIDVVSVSPAGSAEAEGGSAG